VYPVPEASVTPYYADDAVTLYHGDCREILPTLEAVDHVISDPPYDARTHSGARWGGDGKTAGLITFAPLDVNEAVPMLLSTARRWVVCFCTMEMIAAYQAASGDCWVRAGFWRRPDGAPQFTGDRPATPGDAVAIMHAEGKKRWNGGGHHAYWEHGVERVAREHPTQKPESLMREIVTQFTDAGDLILDPFGGSGTTAVAAKRLGRRCIFVEREEKYCEIAAKRLSQGALDLFGETA
jgi:DNA modification methylase